MLIVEPAAFRTDALIKDSVYMGNPIPDYNEMRQAAIERYKRTHEMLRGDPRKAMEAVVDVVRGEGEGTRARVADVSYAWGPECFGCEREV
ncbi:NAD(P)-binding protein [Mycena venus]|uniref:NAD(P)-binding protein n=1 Tax=Mycena venus TaxID=2733690 RepID=A0A8H6YF61_9AGAR|nr:NAD(P)-binding protein [Mycena venus]